MELMDIVVILLVGIGIGFGMMVVYVWILFQRIRGQVDHMVNQIIQQAEADLIGLNIELDKNTYFCYNSEDQQFVCQGTTVSEIRQAFRSRFPTKTAYLAGGDPAVVEQFRTELLKSGANDTGN
jgi:hypothetical protein